MTNTIVPTAGAIQNILTQLLGIDIAVSNVADDSLDDGYVAEYISHNSETLALCIADSGMVVLAGSAFLHANATYAHAMLVSGDVQADVLQSYQEIANILTRVISDNDCKHMRLNKVHEPGYLSESQVDVESFIATSSFYIDIPGYGAGMLTFHV